VTVGTIKLHDFVRAALAAVSYNATALERLDIAIDAHLRQLMSGSGFAPAVIRNVGQLPDSIRSRQIVEERKYAKLWRSAFRDARAEGQLRPDLDPELARQLIIGILNRATKWWSEAQLPRHRRSHGAVNHPARDIGVPLPELVDGAV